MYINFKRVNQKKKMEIYPFLGGQDVWNAPKVYSKQI